MSSLIWKVKGFEDLSTTELYEILRVRQEIFAVQQACCYLDADGYDEKALHLWAEEDGEILAYCRIFDKNIKYPEASIGRVLTSSHHRGKGLGKKLMTFALNVIEARFFTREVRISAQDYLLKFYTDFGFEDTGKKYLEDQIPHTEMKRF